MWQLRARIGHGVDIKELRARKVRELELLGRVPALMPEVVTGIEHAQLRCREIGRQPVAAEHGPGH